MKIRSALEVISRHNVGMTTTSVFFPVIEKAIESRTKENVFSHSRRIWNICGGRIDVTMALSNSGKIYVVKFEHVAGLKEKEFFEKTRCFIEKLDIQRAVGEILKKMINETSRRLKAWLQRSNEGELLSDLLILQNFQLPALSMQDLFNIEFQRKMSERGEKRWINKARIHSRLISELNC